MKCYITNAFAMSMLPQWGATIKFERIPENEVASAIDRGAISAIGHADTAAIVSAMVRRDVPPNRINVPVLDGSTELIIAAYQGPRLPEGATTLPQGAEIRFYRARLD